MSFSYSDTFKSKEEAQKGVIAAQAQGKFSDLAEEFLLVAISGIADGKGVSVSVSGHVSRPAAQGSSSLSVGVSPID